MVASVSYAPPKGGQDPAKPLVRLWDDDRRVQQLARLSAMQMQCCDDEGEQVWELALIKHNGLPDNVRIDLPSPRAFAKILGVLRSAGMLRKNPMTRLELSAEEIGELAGYSKATAEAVLRWLGSAPIKHRGRVVCEGLGLIKRGRRLGLAYLDGALRRIYRTSCITLTFVGLTMLRMAQALNQLAKDRSPNKAAWKKRPKTHVKPAPIESFPPPEEHPPTWGTAGRAVLDQLKAQLKF